MPNPRSMDPLLATLEHDYPLQGLRRSVANYARSAEARFF